MKLPSVIVEPRGVTFFLVGTIVGIVLATLGWGVLWLAGTLC